MDDVTGLKASASVFVSHKRVILRYAKRFCNELRNLSILTPSSAFHSTQNQQEQSSNAVALLKHNVLLLSSIVFSCFLLLIDTLDDIRILWSGICTRTTASSRSPNIHTLCYVLAHVCCIRMLSLYFSGLEIWVKMWIIIRWMVQQAAELLLPLVTQMAAPCCRTPHIRHIQVKLLTAWTSICDDMLIGTVRAWTFNPPTAKQNYPNIVLRFLIWCCHSEKKAAYPWLSY